MTTSGYNEAHPTFHDEFDIYMCVYIYILQHHDTIEGAIERRKSLGRPRKSYIS